MKLCKAISLVFVLLSLSAITINVYAGSVHKWVDAQGVTHYSDQLPDHLSNTSYSVVKQIDVLDTYSASSQNADPQDDYYSVTNQWARMRGERLERKQLQIEKAKQVAAQQPMVPQVVYVNQAEENHSRSAYYPVQKYRQSYGHGLNKTFNSYAGRRNNSTCRLPNSNYSRGFVRSGASFGSSGFRSSRSHSLRSRGSGITLSIR